MQLKHTIPSRSKQSYSITVEAGAIEEIPQVLADMLDIDRIFILYDETLESIAQKVHDTVPESTLLPVPRGESSKSLEQVERIVQEMLMHRASKYSVIINVGGGMTTDLGGFIASVFARGIRCVHVPTNLMGMADAAIGGKTYINVGKVKNMIGTVWYPKAVVADIDFLATLPERQLQEGLVEILKIASMADVELFGWLEEHVDQVIEKDPKILETCVQNAARMKVDVLEKSLKDGESGFLLNFGHTIGHALEALSHFKLSHAEAVSIGMICEMSIAESSASDRIVALLEHLDMPLDFPPDINPDQLWDVILSDKHVRSDGDVRIAIATSIGSADIRPVTQEEVMQACGS